MERKHGFLIVILLLIISGVLAVVTFERSPKAEASEIQQAFMEELKLENPEPCELEWESGTPRDDHRRIDRITGCRQRDRRDWMVQIGVDTASKR